MLFWILTVNLDQDQKQTKRKNDTYEIANVLYEDQELTLNAIKSGTFP